ncbi:LuxR C-terminal-related transcriptional regulator, partial [Kitasatospora sp. NPDC050543]|uniref:LuxR C-terminal-related transcriptional regulator n=1 Tax=Kitasatospora sp. NPDC050543 TaxID=3364054 RepID=UPI0037B48E24
DDPDGATLPPDRPHYASPAEIRRSRPIRQRLLTALVDKSVLTLEERGPRTRYRLPAAARQYGREQLTASGQQHTLYERHRDWYVRLARQAEADWFGPRQSTWRERLHTEYPNLCAALQRSMDDPRRAPAALELAVRLWSHPLAPGTAGEARARLAHGLAADEEPTSTRARALALDGRLALLEGDAPTADTRVGQLRRLLPQPDDHDQDAHRAFATLAGLTKLAQGHPDQALTRLQDALDQHHAANDPGEAVITLVHLTIACFNLADPRAGAHAEQAVALCRAHDAHCSAADALWALALARLGQGRPRSTAALIRRALRNRPVSPHRGDPGEFSTGTAEFLEVLAWSAAEQDRGERAATLLGAAQSARRSAGRPPEVPGQLKVGHERCRTLLHHGLGRTALRAAIRAGAALTPEEAHAFAHERDTTPARPEAATAHDPAPLTRRESEVVTLVALGLTNKEIAARLVVSPRTAEGHVARILAKLGFTTRSQIVAWRTAADH